MKTINCRIIFNHASVVSKSMCMKLEGTIREYSMHGLHCEAYQYNVHIVSAQEFMHETKRWVQVDTTYLIALEDMESLQLYGGDKHLMDRVNALTLDSIMNVQYVGKSILEPIEEKGSRRSPNLLHGYSYGWTQDVASYLQRSWDSIKDETFSTQYLLDGLKRSKDRLEFFEVLCGPGLEYLYSKVRADYAEADELSADQRIMTDFERALFKGYHMPGPKAGQIVRHNFSLQLHGFKGEEQQSVYYMNKKQWPQVLPVAEFMWKDKPRLGVVWPFELNDRQVYEYSFEDEAQLDAFEAALRRFNVVTWVAKNIDQLSLRVEMPAGELKMH